MTTTALPMPQPSPLALYGPVVPLVLYDGLCPLCRSLAGLVERRTGGALSFAPWQEFQQQRPEFTRAADRLRVLLAGELLEGEAAWAFLLANYRDLSALSWLAERTGLTAPAAKAMAAAGRSFRRLCYRCPRP